MNPAVVRHLRAQTAACRVYARAFDDLNTEAALIRAEGGPPGLYLAARQRALIALRAYQNELRPDGDTRGERA